MESFGLFVLGVLVGAMLLLVGLVPYHLRKVREIEEARDVANDRLERSRHQKDELWAKLVEAQKSSERKGHDD